MKILTDCMIVVCTEFDLRPMDRDLPIDEIRYQNLRIPTDLLNRSHIIMFVDGDTKQTTIIKNKWGNTGVIL